MIIAAADAQRVHQAERAIDQLMLRLHRGQRDYELTNNAAMIQAEAKTQNTLSLMLGSIAAISLLVGGIGVMNIMLMTVRERTREIGIRMATGARQGDILRQFLTEAAMLSVVGGLAGIALALCIGGVLLLGQVAVAFSCRPSSAPSVARWSPDWCSASCRRARPPSWTRWPPWPANDGHVHEESFSDFRLPAARRLRRTPAPLDSGLAAPLSGATWRPGAAMPATSASGGRPSARRNWTACCNAPC